MKDIALDLSFLWTGGPLVCVDNLYMIFDFNLSFDYEIKEVNFSRVFNDIFSIKKQAKLK